jgi:hypothetical protein
VSTATTAHANTLFNRKREVEDETALKSECISRRTHIRVAVERNAIFPLGDFAIGEVHDPESLEV